MVIRTMHKRGAIMDLFVVFVTILFIGICMLQYFNSQEPIHAALISPVSVLELSDEAFFFSLEEQALLVDSFCNFNDVEAMKDNFCGRVNGLEHSSFLFENSTPVGISGVTGDSLCLKVYDFSIDGDALIVRRSGLHKYVDLGSEGDHESIQFDMKLDYSLEKEYLLTKDVCD